MDKFTEEVRRSMEEKLRQEFARKIRMVKSSPARPTKSIVRQKLKFYADKCYEFESLHKHAKARFVSLMMDRWVMIIVRRGALRYLLKIEQLCMEHKEERTNLTVMRDQFVLAHEWYEVLLSRLYDLLLKEEKAAVEEAEGEFKRNTTAEDKTLRELRKAFKDLQDNVKKQQHETRELMQAMHQHFEGLVTRAMKDGFRSLREDVKRQQ
ncbi:unnamed protein product [Cylicocyclus nassatus]|uniref:Uncharacterized protein n=1 Tax=Cylicocyclus nassatus TaxID=53992 RepID=A0AA36GSS4_CYLNA|nr:unnamed protein product [Cylicocyclus nassatus]